MITTANIEQTIQDFEQNPNLLDQCITRITESEKLDLFVLLVSSAEEELSEDEYSLLLYLFSVIYYSFEKYTSIPTINSEQILELNESIWDFIATENSFEKIISHYESLTAEKDVIEFLDVALDNGEDDDEMQITDAGVTIMLVSLLTLLFTLSDTQKS